MRCGSSTRLKTTELTRELLSNHLLRRWIGARPRRVLLIHVMEEPRDVVLPGVQNLQCVRWTKSGEDYSAVALNKLFKSAINAAVDLVVLDLRTAIACDAAEPIIVDPFIPVYPVVLSSTVLICSPLQLLQLNGCDVSISTSEDVIPSMISRAAATMGAVLLPKNYNATLPASEDVSYFTNGLCSLESGIFKDGRVTKLQRNLSSHIATQDHGWLSEDTTVALLCALQVVRPKVILELGCWFGRSTRLLAQNAPSDAVIYAADWFKNSAVYTHTMWKLNPVDKLFLKPPRFETFHSNLSAIDTSNTVIMMQMDVYEAVDVIHKYAIVPDLIFVDCEKKTAPLAGFLRKILDLWPGVCIVGDDYVFPSVRKAVAQLNHEHTVTFDEAYAILPDTHSKHSFESAEAAIRHQQRPSDQTLEVAALVEEGRWAAAFDRAGGEAAALHFTVPRNPAGVLLHAVCRSRDWKFLEGAWSRLFEKCDVVWEPPLLNLLNLTPMDYIVRNIKFE